jgi:hypothetical protein
MANATRCPIPAVGPIIDIRPYSIDKWYNIVLIDELTALIDNLNADGEACLYINQEGKAYTEEAGNITVVYEFGEMPAGLFAEAQEENRIFISWV